MILLVGLLSLCGLLLVCVLVFCVFFGLVWSLVICSDALFPVVRFLLLLCLGWDFVCLLSVASCRLAY